MEKENILITAIKAILRIFKKRNPEEEKRISDEMKREMCERAVNAGVCPNDCSVCAWSLNFGEVEW